MLPFENKLSKEFIDKVLAICSRLGLNPDYLIACMAFETGETFSASIRNKYSHAVGLIQFMPKTCASLMGVSNEAIRLMDSVELLYFTLEFANMSEVNQLDYVEKYFEPYKNKLLSLEDTYMAILWPAAIGKPNDFVLFRHDGMNPKRYLQNKGLDYNKDGLITKFEAAQKVRAKLDKGLKQ